MSETRWLIIPMEILERELNGNLLLCMEAIKAGWQCIIGTKRAIYDAAEYLPSGAVFLKSITASEIGNMQLLKKGGRKLVSLDVEGLVYVSLEEFVSNRFTYETLDETDRLFFWGDVQRNAIAEAYPDYAEKFITTGSPIADLWKNKEFHALHKDRVEELQGRYGKYILLPSAFALPNHHLGREANFKIMLRDRMIADMPDVHEFWMTYEEHVYQVFEQFLDVVPHVSKAFPDHTIIIRPHPSESAARWVEKAEGLDNVQVIFEGAITPWVIGSEAVLQWGCTTAIEAFLIGRPVVSYNPIAPPIRKEDEERFDHKLPHTVSITNRTPEETVQSLKRVLEGKKDMPKAEDLKKWIYNAPEGAAAEIMSHLQNLDLNPDTLRPLPAQKVTWKERVWRVIEAFSKIGPIRKIMPHRISWGLDTRSYGRHKTKTISPEALEQSVQTFGKILNIPDIGSKQLRDNLYWVGHVDK